VSSTFKLFGGRQVDPERLQHIVFVSNLAHDQWGGSEELWSRTALNLAEKGLSIAASVHYWPTPHHSMLKLTECGVDVGFRNAPQAQPFWRRGWPRLMRRLGRQLTEDLESFVCSRDPVLVVLSSCVALPSLNHLELCARNNLPFVTIGHSNCIDWWPTDAQAEKYRELLSLAKRCFFVAEANRSLAELQLGWEFRNAEIVRNPFNVPADACPPWPPMDSEQGLRLACVARIHPPNKGHDLLLQVLASAPWAQREWVLTIYGEGPMRHTLERLVDRFGLTPRVKFAGFVDNIESVWASNHVLVLPSRFEGLPLAIVEAMYCGRPVVATDVGGNSEIIEHGATGFLAKVPTVGDLSETLEQAWQKRFELESMGELASRRIRELVPEDPIEVFSERLLAIAMG
jgi:glycosyltransferase involved in cell wall biosynthesis